MSSATQQPLAARDTRASIFGRILVGVDDSPESLEAARQAVALATGTVTLLAAYDVTHAVVGAGMAPVPVGLDEAPFRERAVEALERTRQELAPIAPVGKIARGRAWQILLDEIIHGEDTLVAVGSHGAGRAKGILIGSTATELVHKAPCSVLVARKPMKDFPSSIVVGLDGSTSRRWPRLSPKTWLTASTLGSSASGTCRSRWTLSSTLRSRPTYSWSGAAACRDQGPRLGLGAGRAPGSVLGPDRSLVATGVRLDSVEPVLH